MTPRKMIGVIEQKINNQEIKRKKKLKHRLKQKERKFRTFSNKEVGCGLHNDYSSVQCASFDLFNGAENVITISTS